MSAERPTQPPSGADAGAFDARHDRARVESGAAPAWPWAAWRAGLVAADAVLAVQTGAAGLASRRDARLRALLDVALTRSPIYRDWLGGRDPATIALSDLPVAGKSALMAQFDRWVTDPLLTLEAVRAHVRDTARIGAPLFGRYTVWESSGSSGVPGLFVQDEQAMAVYDALESVRRPMPPPTLAQLWLDPWRLTERIVFVGATGGHHAGAVTIERLRRMHPAAAARVATVSFMQPMARLVERLDQLSPTVLATYPSLALELARERRGGRLGITPRAVWTGGEMLGREAAELIGAAFGCPVTDTYGASECLTLASACGHGALHLNSDWAILESVDEHGAPVPAGQPGARTLLTNLANHVQPVIRYDLGDRVTLQPARCACGSSLPVVSVEGRCDETLRLPGSTGAGGRAARRTASTSIAILPLAVASVLEDDAGLFDFQLRQTGRRRLVLTSATEAGRLPAARAALLRYLEAQGARGVDIRCAAAPSTRAASGKLKRIAVESADDTDADVDRDADADTPRRVGASRPS